MPLGDSSAPAAIAAGRLSQAGHVSGGVGCGYLAAFQRQHGGHLRSFWHLRCVLSFRPFADCFQSGVIFCACEAVGFLNMQGGKLCIAPTPRLFSGCLGLLGCTAGLHAARLRHCTRPCLARAHDKLCVSVVAGRTSRFTYWQGAHFERPPPLPHPQKNNLNLRVCANLEPNGFQIGRGQVLDGPHPLPSLTRQAIAPQPETMLTQCWPLCSGQCGYVVAVNGLQVGH